MNSLWFDVRFTLRLLRKAPGFSLISIMVIALSVALFLTIYVVVRNQGMAPLPIPNGDRYVALQHIYQDSGQLAQGDQFHADTIQALQVLSHSFEFIGAARLHGATTLNDGDLTEARWGTEISVELLALTGVDPILGRSFDLEDEDPRAPAVVLIGYQFWQNFFGARTDIVGHRVRVEGEWHTIVGVMPEGFSYPTDHHLWRPLRLTPNSPPGDHSRHFTPIGILKPGIDLQQASREAAEIVGNLQRQHPDHYENLSAKAIPFVNAASLIDFDLVNKVMLAAGISILLLACLNVGNLLMVRGNERSRELVIRSAVGGTQGRIIRQVMLESLVISAIGGGLGLYLGSFGAQFVEFQTENVVGSSYLPFWMRFDIGADVVFQAVAITALIWLLAGGIPSWRASRADISKILNSGTKGGSGGGQNRTYTALVASEVVISFFLLALSGAFVGAVNAASKIDFGISTGNTVNGFLVFDTDRYEDPRSRLQYLEQLTALLESRSGVIAATYASTIPGKSGWFVDFDLPDIEMRQSGTLPKLQSISVADDYFQALGVKLLEGRFFEPTDTDDNLEVTIIDKTMADFFWPGESALGKMIMINPNDVPGRPPKRSVTIIGVISPLDQGQALGRSKGVFNLYHHMAQFAPSYAHIIVKLESLPDSYDLTIRNTATSVDRDIALSNIQPLATSMTANTRLLEALAQLFALIAIVALVLAGTGIYGVVSRGVQLRTKEMGIRRALGQTDGQTIRYFLRQGTMYLLAGVLIGGAGAAATTWLLSAEFPVIQESIGSVLFVAGTVMSALVLAASYFPALRIVRLDPASALHCE